jgi:hypothetical protein
VAATDVVTFLQPITHRGRLAAVASRDRFFLCGELEQRPPGDAEACFVAFMCVYARDIACGELPGPYRDEDARRFARPCLIPTELLERETLDVQRVAAALGIPADEVAVARATQAPPDAATAWGAGRATPLPCQRRRSATGAAR